MFSHTINNILVTTIIGCHHHEKQQAQPISISLKYTLNNVTKDSLTNVTNYKEVLHFTKITAKNTKFELLEYLTKHLTEKLLEKFKDINKINIKIKKMRLEDDITVSYTQSRTNKVAIALGSNCPYNAKQNIISATLLLQEYITELKSANLYYTKPYKTNSTINFINTVITGNTILSINTLFSKIKKVEFLMHKKDLTLSYSRTIDIDLLLYNNTIQKDLYLTVPHSNMLERDFVLIPLSEIAADWIHPTTNKSILTLKNSLSLPVNIIKIVD